ncbi:hypothetical protein [Mycobacterium intracellulare]|uniref:Uncharacterized protein n=1 Tax=Mycobacterium intracellulare TaxID=1767 RepID=A0AAE4U7Q9_MYCIT|nr:hypothetical protein [Mycobacterium intracellulare]MDV6975318.1 hypothetical protein [Mycobacterium intracellulare]MDV6980382.1 hypothetical protein [Mycobacterium intracellulare]MDV7010811.1 hypothetical protein [Mycobacterium intracellulare]MDV7025717.1 hypothetical protein [Mycobacterium intracellulare]
MSTAVESEATATQQVLLEMWTENTGRHMLDSGGAYGRNWERNQGLTVADMLASPEVTLDARYGYVDITVSAFHWLDSFLEYDPEMQARFEEFATSGDMTDEPWLECAERFAEDRYDSCNDPYGGVRSYNTYNGESWLDSTLQYVTFTAPDADGWDTPYVLLQYHGGCDVRGGYTKPRAFKVLGEGHDEFYTEGHVSLCCTANHGQYIGEGLFGPVDAPMHCWDSNSSGSDWVEYGGAYDSPEFEVVEPEDGGDNYVACPACKAPMEVSVFFGH